MEKRFELKPSQETKGWYVLTDTKNLVVIKFKEHYYNETQKVSILDEQNFMNAQNIATVLREMGEYMFTNWYSIAFPVQGSSKR